MQVNQDPTLWTAIIIINDSFIQGYTKEGCDYIQNNDGICLASERQYTTQKRHLSA